jgi:hypothetical protein
MKNINSLFNLLLFLPFIGCNNVGKESIDRGDSANLPTTTLSNHMNDSVNSQNNSAIPIDSLLGAWVALGTPETGDDKNGDDSNLYIDVYVTTTDGKRYRGYAEAGNRTGIGPRHVIGLPISFKKYNGNFNNSQINYQNLGSVDTFTVIYVKPNYNEFNHDKWNARAEVVFHFKDDKYLTTGYNEPQTELTFYDLKRTWVPFSPYPHTCCSITIPRSKMFDRPTLNEPVK